MGKIVKYCSSCDEGFAERFGFCPDCGAPLQAFEMNPVDGMASVPASIETAPAEQPIDATPISVEPEIPVTSFVETEAEEVDATPIEVEEAPASFDEVEDEPIASFDDGVFDQEVDHEVTDEVYETPATNVTYVSGAGLTGLIDGEYRESRRARAAQPSAPAAPAFVGGSNFLGLSDESARAHSSYQYQGKYADVPDSAFDAAAGWDYSHPDDGGFYVTVVQDKNHKQRNQLLLGATALVTVIAVFAWGVSLFGKTLEVGAIGSENSLAYLIDEVPMPIEDEPQKADKEKGGGGGGGGREEKEETSQGDLADQSRTPTHIKPDVSIVKNDNFELKQPIATTEGDRKFPKIYDRYGDPNSKFGGLSNGTGSGGGQGSGIGQGQGSGYGTGAGSGSGSGSGGGYGSGNGDGSGPGGGGPPSIAVAKVTSPLKIISKPQAKYTDEGRTNNVQGSVRLKVTLLASGQVGSITPVTRLPHGLTEQAIAAARLLRFDPAKVNGVPVSKTITIDYSFTIY
ncbi:MAG TPA: TonB family protein [Pyrinomonadaceae bacterium]|nr:TonB family protein [Pyrinomonadaceae bacterium]